MTMAPIKTLDELLAEIAVDPKVGEAVGKAIRFMVRQELAALGGHLASVYGLKPLSPSEVLAAKVNGELQTQDNPQLATLGGYLLEHYGA